MSKYDILNLGIDIVEELKELPALKGRVIEVNCKLNLLITIYVTDSVTEDEILKMHDSIKSYALNRLNEVTCSIDLEFIDIESNEILYEFDSIRNELKTWNGNYGSDLEGKVVLTESESRKYLNKPGFYVKTFVIDDKEGYEKYGYPAYVIDRDTLDQWNSN